jgi:type I restriction enzyme S subunit
MNEWTFHSFGSAPLQMIDGDRGKNYPNGTDFNADGYCLFLSERNVTKSGFLFDETMFVSADKDASLRAGKLLRGDVVLTTRGTVGNVAYFDESVPFAHVRVNSGMLILRPNRARLDPRYLYYFLRSDAMAQQIESLTSGSAQPQLPVRDLSNATIPVPSMHEQHAIAEVLGAIDDKIAANTKLAHTASDLAGLIYDRVTAQFESQPMSQVLRPVLGGTPPRSRDDFWEGERLWASAKDVTGADFGVVTDTFERITDLAVASTKAKPLPKGSVILTARGTVGAVARLAAPASFNQSCYGFVPGDIPEGVLYFAVQRATERAKEIAHGSVFDTITMKTFDHLSFPDFDSAAMSRTEAMVGPLLNSITAAVTENGSLARTRDALLPQLMSGKLRVKDAKKVLEDAGV